ncbi:Uncharacterised protein [Oligella urethralis]|nr:Uncharacterised protein [Oligella urethralis]
MYFNQRYSQPASAGFFVSTLMTMPAAILIVVMTAVFICAATVGMRRCNS